MTDITVAFAAGLAREAAQAGLLTPAALEELLRETMRRRAVGELFEAMDHMETAGGAPMTEDEIQAEIDAVRAARK